MQSVINVQLIQEYIEKNSISKTEFCRRCKISYRVLQNIMSGQTKLRLIPVFKIANLLKVSLDSLIIRVVKKIDNKK